MRRVKIFKGVETELWNLEEEINNWVEASGAKIVQVTGNIAPQTPSSSAQGFSSSDVLVIVLYEASE
ncbi:MAG: hypothetical protein CMJ75_01835 [Planctomycetaceae bacterium]|nr:hypothetical protein [Planctomycetaceae bacterium]